MPTPTRKKLKLRELSVPHRKQLDRKVRKIRHRFAWLKQIPHPLADPMTLHRLNKLEDELIYIAQSKAMELHNFVKTLP